MNRRISLTIAVSDDGTKCAPECPFLDVSWESCSAVDRALKFDMDKGVYERHAACAEAEQATREAEASAFERAFDLAEQHAAARDRAIARIRGGGR